ncbi:MAG: class I SAM-dependent methyltransferase [bacterium]|nr:class I SAM-dependent methyltransferase [bacterium]
MFNERAKDYDNLKWVWNDEYLDRLIKICDVKKSHTVVDMGTGTGAVASCIAPYCKEVIAVDSSEEMLKEARERHSADNIEYYQRDVTEPVYAGGADCIIARMVLHHVTNEPCHVVGTWKDQLKPGGKLVIAEGIPHEGIIGFFTNVFDKKEERFVFGADELIVFVDGMKDITLDIIPQPDMSLNNWLDNSGVEGDKEEIFAMHVDAPAYVKKAYNMRFKDGDIIMDWRTAIVSGVK